MTRSRTALLALISTSALCLPIGLAGPSSAATNPAPKVVVKAPNPRTGVVTGRIALPPGTAAEGSIRTLQGKNITLSTPSKGTVAIDATSGAFTYTPTLAARHAAARIGASPADRSDSFTVTISDPDSGFHIHGMATVPVLALNSAPRAQVKASSYDPTTGVVTGTVTATERLLVSDMTSERPWSASPGPLLSTQTSLLDSERAPGSPCTAASPPTSGR